MYVDDSITSFDDVDDAYYFYETVKSCLQKGNFDLRKWITNNENLQHRINEHKINYKPTDDYHKVLGLNWDNKNDEFIFEFSQAVLEANKLAPTKRSVLKITGMFFDPLGLILPIIIQSKLMFQRACVTKFSWDSLLSTECRESWDKFLYELNSLDSVSIKRHILCNCGNRVMGVNSKPGGFGEAIDCTKFSSLDKLLRITSYVSKFINNVKFRIGKSEVILNDEISTDEINASRITWLKYEQSFLVAESKFDKLKSSLKLFCGKDSIWRLKTRLNQLITFSYRNKFPILLRSQSHFTVQVILKIHERTYHSVVGVTLSNIRELYGIVKGRQIVKKVLRKCVLRKFIQGLTITAPETLYLPSFRINCNHAFEHVGVDYAGPIFYRNLNKQSTELFY